MIIRDEIKWNINNNREWNEKIIFFAENELISQFYKNENQ